MCHLKKLFFSPNYLIWVVTDECGVMLFTCLFTWSVGKTSVTFLICLITLIKIKIRNKKRQFQEKCTCTRGNEKNKVRVGVTTTAMAFVILDVVGKWITRYCVTQRDLMSGIRFSKLGLTSVSRQLVFLINKVSKA